MSCEGCGSAIESLGVGRPRRFCLTCRPRKRASVRASKRSAQRALVSCVQCGKSFHTHMPERAKFCTHECKDLARRVPCSTCERPMWPSRGASCNPMCHECRRAKPGYRPANMRARGMIQTWVCGDCGAQRERPATKGQIPKWCERCRVLRKNPLINMSGADRLAIYERDDWTCGLCREQVDSSLIGSLDVWRPSLDHIVPRSLGGTDAAANLRLAHFWCNSVRGDGSTSAAELFDVAS